MVDTALITKLKTLSAADRLELFSAVWETLSPEDTPATEEEKAMLDARLQDLEANPTAQNPWPEVQVRLQRLLP